MLILKPSRDHFFVNRCFPSFIIASLKRQQTLALSHPEKAPHCNEFEDGKQFVP